jgi:lipopolysaccharide/colanic/teichoic acid biosynthesis glycosyltransferase
MQESIARLRADSASRVVEENLRSPPLGGAWKRAFDIANVIRGYMSLIGPRPRPAAEFSDYFTQEQECLRARPGFISIWQSYYPALTDQHAEIALDRQYVCNWSARLDFALLCNAIFAIRRADPA